MKSLVSFFTGACGVYALASVPKLHFLKEEEEEEVYCEVNTKKAPVLVSSF